MTNAHRWPTRQFFNLPSCGATTEPRGHDKAGEPYHPGLVAEWAADWKLAWESAAPLFPNERNRLAYLEQTSIELYRLFDQEDHWAALAAIVDSLLAHETLDGEEVEDIVRQWLS